MTDEDPIEQGVQRGWATGLSLIESGAYWEAHEALESLWHDTDAQVRSDAIQALIQFAAAAYKIEQARDGRGESSMQRGMGKLIKKALALLSGASSVDAGMDVDALERALREMEVVREQWVRGGTAERAAAAARDVASVLVDRMRGEQPSGLV